MSSKLKKDKEEEVLQPKKILNIPVEEENLSSETYFIFIV